MFSPNDHIHMYTSVAKCFEGSEQSNYSNAIPLHCGNYHPFHSPSANSQTFQSAIPPTTTFVNQQVYDVNN